jgi:hypothetical protein
LPVTNLAIQSYRLIEIRAAGAQKISKHLNSYNLKKLEAQIFFYAANP